jgi:hypothetical protein
LLVFAPIIGCKQNDLSQLLITTSVSSAVITNARIFDARVTQTGDTKHFASGGDGAIAGARDFAHTP